MDRDSLRSGGVGRRSGSQSRGSMQQRKPLSIPTSSATDTPTTGSAFDSCGIDAQSALYESIDDDDIVYDQVAPAVDVNFIRYKRTPLFIRYQKKNQVLVSSAARKIHPFLQQSGEFVLFY
ncbi:hypothetical protein OUZ56_031661 [Daphnia magna]|uniref:Uncharacterized protein n=1 Tax=Daphnia magna TaxID=35525 RepID=A0ABQ9ZUV5_9CRUS|nr:hypothetical protein OUZ56_031661 [Daphnia magna]